MQVTAEQIISDLIASPGLGMFAWLCAVYFFVAMIIFAWAIKSGQMHNIEDIKFDMLEDSPQNEVISNG